MPGPYIFSNLSNSVVSSDREGVSPFTCNRLEPGASSEGIAGALSLSVSSSLVELELISTSCAIASSDFTEDTDTSLGRLLPLVLADLCACLVSSTFFPDFLSRFLSVERIVGGSCIGSPAKINFFALKMGTQHTYQAVSTRHQRGDSAKNTQLPLLAWLRR